LGYTLGGARTLKSKLLFSIIVFGFAMEARRRLGLGPSRAMRRRWYETVSQAAALMFGDAFTLMNLGYAEVGAKGEEPARAEQYPINLYRFMIGSIDNKCLSSSTILEVGSGRGGGANFLVETFRARKFIGLDLSQEATTFSRRHYQTANLEFIQGDALNLPFESESFDIVINVESSHCYPDMSAFLSEVYRVLKPGGHFFLADHRRANEVPELMRALATPNWSRFNDIDITANVVAALEADSDRKARLIDQGKLPRLAKVVCKEFAACVG
jgi:SAM-dependent methyltransferase